MRMEASVDGGTLTMPRRYDAPRGDRLAMRNKCRRGDNDAAADHNEGIKRFAEQRDANQRRPHQLQKLDRLGDGDGCCAKRLRHCKMAQGRHRRSHGEPEGVGERGRRGHKLPRGLQKVDRMEVKPIDETKNTASNATDAGQPVNEPTNDKQSKGDVIE